MVLYIVRHGESIANSEMIFAGYFNTPLSETGRKQAELLINYFKDIKIDKIYSSDLVRAYDTVLPTAKAHSIEIIKEENLREIYAGDWEGRKFTELYSESELYRNWVNDIGNYGCENGETTLQLQKRIYDAIYKIAKENPDKNVLIGTHATPIRTFMTSLMGKTLSDMKDIPFVPNATVTKVIFEDDKFILQEAGISSHLGELVTELPTDT